MGKLNVDAMKSKLDKESQSSGYTNATYDKLEQGKNVRRVLWPKGDKESFYSEGYLHFSLGAEGNKVVTCPKTFNSKNKCPVCEYVEQLQKSKSKDDKKLADNIKAKRRIYVNVINRDDDEETAKVLPIGVTILKGLLEAICDADYGDITDPEDGRDVTITRKGQGLKTEYSILPKPKSSIVSESLTIDEIEEEMTDLDSLFVEKTYEEIEAVMNGEEEDDEDEDDEESGAYDEMDVDELESICKKRKIKLPAKVPRLKLITLLNKWDDEHDSSDEDEDEDDEDEPEEDTEDTSEDSEDDEESDEVQDAIAAALAKRKKGKK